MLRRILVVFILCLPLLPQVYAQKNPDVMADKYQSRWKAADSLLERNLPESAARIAASILKDAEMQRAGAQIIKARLFLMNVADRKEENSTVENIKKAEGYIAAAEDDVTRSIWQSIAAQLYWDYFEGNRYKFYSRTAVAAGLPDDIETWDAAAFIRKAGTLYQSSIENRTVLQSIPVESYAPVILEGKNTRKLRPTLYDLLVFRALSFFENEEKDIINPADKFEIESPLWFEEAARFSEVRIKVRNDNSLHFGALKLYQELIAFHLHDRDPSALIDADLQRLAFVQNNSVHPDKDSLYVEALRQLEQKYTGHPASAQVSYLIAAQLAGNEPTPVYRPAAAPVTPKKKRDLPAVKARLQRIIAAHPDTEGGINAHNLLLALETKVLNVTTEEANIPGAHVKALLTYKNTDGVHLELYRAPHEANFSSRYNDEGGLLTKPAGLQLLKSWYQPLPAAADMEQHSVEVPLDALPAGTYRLVASLKKDINDQSNLASVTTFQVSGLSFIMENEAAAGYVLDRKSGYPVANVRARFWAQSYNNSRNRYEPRSMGDAVSDAAGRFSVPAGEGSYENRLSAITLYSATDSLYVNGYFNAYYPGRDEPDQTHTFFFTDRSIYRPGQTIYFKGIMVKSSRKGRSNEIIANQASAVTLYDANNQKIASLDVTTNGFGSFSGKFVAPEGLLGGQMHIENGSGSVYFSVEEYKRPKFYVAFDTLKDSYALNETITVKGSARAYAGNNVDGARVRYRVVRRARFPYFWCYYHWGMPASPEMEITNGEAVTGEDGSFTISFPTIPDRSVSPQTLPVFTYAVYADVTDINGETRSGNTYVNCGYRSLQITAEIPEESRPQDLDTLTIRTENLNGTFTPAVVKVTVAPLKFPGFLRKRLWETPDQSLLSEQEFRKLFPQDEYKNESSYLNWEKESALWEQVVETTAGGQVRIPETTWRRNGWYVIEISGKDLQGNDIVEKKYTHVWTPGRQEPNQKDLIVYTDKNSYEPGEELQLWVATAADNPYLLKAARTMGNIDADRLDKNPARLKISEEDRGGMAFSWLYVYNNRIYTATRVVDVPWSNKELQLEWATHRDKLQPGESEEWTLTIKGNKKEAVAAELLAGMYDASLDAFRPHRWDRQRLFPTVYMNDTWNRHFGFGMTAGRLLHYPKEPAYREYEKRYDDILIDRSRQRWIIARSAGGRVAGSMAKRELAEERYAAAPAMDERLQNSVAADLAAPVPEAGGGDPDRPEDQQIAAASVNIRTDLNETAFFLPQMGTDAEGNVQLTFTMPQALTEWKLMAFAHTKDWKTGFLEGKIKTQKDLMVTPGLPRFLRQNDVITISSKISNLSSQALSGEATLELLDALTLQPVHLPFRLKENKQAFAVAAGQSTAASWTIHVPESMYAPVVIRIVAKAGNFSDGEENTLPVVTNRMLVTETLPLPVRGKEEKSFTLEKLLHNRSSSVSNYAYTVEFTGNPAWYAVQALPYLAEYPYECAEQIFNRFYANALAGHIVSRSPRIEKIFAQWKDADTTALLSNLQKNEALKSALLQETPWVMEAKNESEQKRRIASLFETHRLARDLGRNLDKLEQMQLTEGSFPWFKGMAGDRYITQYIVTGLARLQHLGVNPAAAAGKITDRALAYLDRKIAEDYEALIKGKQDLKRQQIGYSQIQYLYMRSFYKNRALPSATQKAFEYYKKQAADHWSSFNPYLAGHLALALDRFGEKETAEQIIRSLRETAIYSEEFGMYWKNMPQGYQWYEAPVEAQSLLIEAFSEVAHDDKATDALKIWLLKQKQTQSWPTTRSTADACYALLLKGSDWLENEPVVTIQAGSKTITSEGSKAEAGTGYFKKKYTGPEVENAMGNIQVSVQTPDGKNEGVSWGAVYWQYFENLDEITAAATPLSVKKQLFIERNSAQGPVLTEIRDGNELKTGDKVKVRIEIRSDRNMEYVHLKDVRAACFEPVNVLSSYKYQGGLGYYEHTKDASTSFFFDYLPKGTYVFEYPVYVAAKGDFSAGISTIQCMYAPEFSSHSEGVRVTVK